MVLFSGGAYGSLLRLKCPHCGEIQARARKPEDKTYACRRCHRKFELEQGLAAAGGTDPFTRRRR